MDQLTNKFFAQSSSSAPEVIAITSGKGGVGKTNLSVNLSLTLQKMNRRILLFDADIHLGNVDLFLGLRPRYSIMDFAINNVAMSDVIMRNYHGVDILPSSASIHSFVEQEKSIINKLGRAFKDLESQYDNIVVDTGAGIGENVISFLLGADKIVLLVTPDPASIADAYGVIKIVKSFSFDGPIIMVSNMVRSNVEGERIFQKMNLMVRRFLKSQIIYAGSITEDDLILDAIRQQIPVILKHPESPAVSSIKAIAHRIIKQPRKMDTIESTLFKRVRNNRQLLNESDSYV
ncbi:MAG: AAA family ATPase [Fidelibacterota bacterium]